MKHFLSSLRAVQTAVSHIVFPLPKGTAYSTTGRTDLVAALVSRSWPRNKGWRWRFQNTMEVESFCLCSGLRRGSSSESGQSRRPSSQEPDRLQQHRILVTFQLKEWLMKRRLSDKTQPGVLILLACGCCFYPPIRFLLLVWFISVFWFTQRYQESDGAYRPDVRSVVFSQWGSYLCSEFIGWVSPNTLTPRAPNCELFARHAASVSVCFQPLCVAPQVGGSLARRRSRGGSLPRTSTCTAGRGTTWNWALLKSEKVSCRWRHTDTHTDPQCFIMWTTGRHLPCTTQL